MHVGEKPYVVTATGPAELAAKPLTIPAMTGMLDQLLPPDSRQALNEVGAVEYHLPQEEAAAGVRYSIVAARGGDDIWIELRRRKEPPAPEPAARMPEPEIHHAPEPTIEYIPVMEQAPEPSIQYAPEPHILHVPEPTIEYIPVVEQPPDPVLERFGVPDIELDTPIDLPIAAAPEPAPAGAEDAFELTAGTEDVRFEIAGFDERDEDVTPAPARDTHTPVLDFNAPQEAARTEPEPDPEPEPFFGMYSDPAAAAEPEPVVARAPEPAVRIERAPDPVAEPAPEPQAVIEPELPPEPEIELVPEPERAPTPAVVVPIARVNVRVEQPARPSYPPAEGLQHLLQVAAAHGASALYVAPQAKPSLRVDGEIRVLDEAPLSETQLQSGVQALAGGGGDAVFPIGEIATYDVPEVGRVQCLGFRDHRGLGAMFKMLPARAISAEQIGLSAAIQALCTEPEGLVLVAGARGSGKSTLVAALVDQINRTRRDHVITVESQIQFVHENRSSFVSQREARDEEAFGEAVRSALREAPDVLVIDQVSTDDVAEFALHAAANGHLVVASLTAASTAAALTRFAEFFGEERAPGRLTLSEHLRGVITQTLLRKTGGGRAAAREVLVNVPSVSSLIADGRFDQLAGVMNGGRRVGMVPLNDALLGLVKSGALDVREAWRKSPDQQELVAMLNREGVDTAFAERLTGS